MRVATNTLYDRGLASINLAQQALSHTQQVASTGHRVNTASDDPVAATEILRTNSQLANNTQYMANQDAADGLLSQSDSTLGQINDLLQSVRTTVVAANNGALSDSDRAALGTELKSRIDALVSLANTKDGNGNFLFSGYQSTVAPFARTASGAAYSGDDGTRLLQVGPARQMETTVNGADIFNRIPTGNGVFTTAPSSANTGNGTIDVGQVTTPSALTGHTYQVQFATSGGATTYQVFDATANAVVQPPAAYTSGTAISVAGMRVTISGAPAAGDQFTIAPSTKKSVFDALQSAADLLSQPSGGPAGLARIASGMLSAVANIDNAIDNVSSVRATVGVRQNEIDALKSTSSASDIQGQSKLSDLQEADYAKVASDLARQQTALEAAQKSFPMISGKSLFDYL